MTKYDKISMYTFNMNASDSESKNYKHQIVKWLLNFICCHLVFVELVY